MAQVILPSSYSNSIYSPTLYGYSKMINLCKATNNEIELLNRINIRHCQYFYGRQRLMGSVELVATADFLPFLEYIHSCMNASPTPALAATNLQLSEQRRSFSLSQQMVDTSPNLAPPVRRCSNESTKGIKIAKSIDMGCKTVLDSRKSVVMNLPELQMNGVSTNNLTHTPTRYSAKRKSEKLLSTNVSHPQHLTNKRTHNSPIMPIGGEYFRVIW
jgi:hypothetical protein